MTSLLSCISTLWLPRSCLQEPLGQAGSWRSPNHITQVARSPKKHRRPNPSSQFCSGTNFIKAPCYSINHLTFAPADLLISPIAG